MVFGSYARYYDWIYQEKDYEAEIEDLKNTTGLKNGDSVLDLGCGTGGHDIPLANQGFVVTGVDVSEDMLRQATRKSIESGAKVRFVLGDIRSLRLGTTFDVVVSMFAVMGYQTSNDDFLAGLQTARAHLSKGGVFLFDTWFGPAVLANRPQTRIKELVVQGERVIRIAEPELDALWNTVTVHYTILRFGNNKLMDETRESHPMRYFFAPEIDLFAHQAAFKVSKICPFMNPDREPTNDDWNVTWLLKAV